MFRLCIVVLLQLTIVGTVSAQKFLQIERAGSLKVHRFMLGDQLWYQLDDGRKEWTLSYVTDIDADQGIVTLDLLRIPLSDLRAIKLTRENRARRTSPLFRTLTKSGIVWCFWTGVAILAGNPPGVVLGLLGPLQIVTGQVGRLLKRQKFVFKGRHRLRVVDLTYYGDDRA